MADVIVAGHLCLDIIPNLPNGAELIPGRLVEAGAANLSTGGAVSNVGLALRKLGIDVRLIGLVGNDLFGRATLELLGPDAEGIVLSPNEITSYTIVLNLVGQDRMFLHAPGCNRSFRSSDVTDDQLKAAKLMHFGYPPLLDSMIAHDGADLLNLFQRAKRAGATTSLDMSLPDPNSPSGEVDWPKILRRVLPFVDVFCPSLDELQFMLRSTASAPELAQEVLRMGVKVALVKQGSEGLYLRTMFRIVDPGRAFEDNCQMVAWHDITKSQACFPVQVVGTTGSGDATIAGFLMGVLRGMSPEEALVAACAVGACGCESADAVSGIRTWTETSERIQREWTIS